MKKRILTMLLAVCLVLALGTVSALADGGLTADENGNIQLTGNTTGTLVVNNGEEITLDLNGFTLTNTDGQNTITVNAGGKLTIVDNSQAKTGTVDNVSHARAAVYNNVGGTVILNGGSYTRSLENGNTATDNGGNSYYNILNHGTMTINAGVTVEQGGGYSSMIENGWQNGTQNTSQTVSKLTINGGTFSGGLNTIKNDDYGDLEINGGTFTNVEQSAVLNWNVAKITGGEFTRNEDGAHSVILNGYADNTMDKGELTITGGVFNGSGANSIQLMGGAKGFGTINISGGEFNGNIAAGAVATVPANVTIAGTAVVNGDIATGSEKNTFAINGVTVNGDIAGGAKTTIVKATVSGNVTNSNATIVDSVVNGKPTTSEGVVAMIGNTPYTSLADAIAAVPEGGTIEIIDDILDVDLNEGSGQNGVFNINSGMAFTINGNGHTIRVSTDHANADTNVHVFNVTNGEVTFTNLTVDGGEYARHGIQAHGAKAEVILNNVTSINNEGYGVIANAGGTVTANYLTTDGNGWGGVNVEANGQISTFNMKDGNLKEDNSIVFENGKSTGSAVANLDGGTFNVLQVKTPSVDIDINGGTYDSIEVAEGVTIASGTITVDGASFNEPVSGIAETEDYQVYYGGVYAYYDSFSKAWNAVGRGNANAAIAYVGEGSGAAAEVVTFKVGEKTVTYTVPYGFEISLPSPYNYSTKFLGWECSRDGDLYKVNAKYTVYRDVTFTATYEVTGYNIYIDRSIENGEVSTSPSGSAAAGETVYIYVDPDTGYVLDELTASWGYNYRYELSLRSVRDGVYRFTMPEGNVYITAAFERSNLRMPFTDVNRGDWFYDAVYYVWANDMMEGVSDTSFNPNGSMTRAMFWAVLGRIDGETITGSDWVEEARDWAMSEGVSDGENPYALVTREQMVTMLWRYAGEPGRSANLNRYTDAGSISDWAEDAMEWAIARGVIDGMTSTTLQPQGTATRAHCATIFMRYDQL